MRARPLSPLVHCSFLLCLSGLALALAPQPAQDPKQEKPDAQSSYEPRSKPGAGQKLLEKMVGDFDVVKTFYPRGGGEPTKQSGTCKQRMIHDGRFLSSEFTFRGEQGVTTGQGLIGWEEDPGVFTSVWTDSRSTRMSFRSSKEKFDGAEIVLWSRSLAESGDKDQRRSRTSTRLEDDGKRLIHRQYSVQQDGKERLVMELAMTRGTK